MKIEMMNIKEIKPYGKNPRYNDNAVQAVANSIKEFGFKVPIIIDKNNVIICGHTRYKASIYLGLETVPVIKADDLSDAKVKAFRIADNKTAELASWDYDKLREELSLIDSNEMLDFGFTESELDIEPEVESDIDNYDIIDFESIENGNGRMIITYSTTLEEKWLKSKLKEQGILKDHYKISQVINKQEADNE